MGFTLVVLLYCLIGLTTLLGVWVIAVYNGLVRLHRQVRGARTQIDMQLQQWSQLVVTMEELDLSEQLIGTACQHYNDTVSAYNAKLRSMPTRLVAALCAFKEEEPVLLTV